MQPRPHLTAAVLQVLGGATLVLVFFVYLVLRPAWSSWLPTASTPWLGWGLHGVAFLALTGGVSLLATGWTQLKAGREVSASGSSTQ